MELLLVDNFSASPASSGSRNTIPTPARGPVTIKNIGDVTAYIGSVDNMDEHDCVPAGGGFPLLPGETRDFIPPFSPDDGSGYRLSASAPEGGTNAMLKIMLIRDTAQG